MFAGDDGTYLKCLVHCFSVFPSPAKSQCLQIPASMVFVDLNQFHLSNESASSFTTLSLRHCYPSHHSTGHWDRHSSLFAYVETKCWTLAQLIPRVKPHLATFLWHCFGKAVLPSFTLKLFSLPTSWIRVPYPHLPDGPLLRPCLSNFQHACPTNAQCFGFLRDHWPKEETKVDDGAFWSEGFVPDFLPIRDCARPSHCFLDSNLNS